VTEIQTAKPTVRWVRSKPEHAQLIRERTLHGEAGPPRHTATGRARARRRTEHRERGECRAEFAILLHHLEAHAQHLLEEDVGELRVRERERPEPQVGGRVGDGAQHELDGLDDLVDEDLAEVLRAPGDVKPQPLHVI
jgi:hypothetical protein